MEDHTRHAIELQVGPIAHAHGADLGSLDIGLHPNIPAHQDQQSLVRLDALGSLHLALADHGGAGGGPHGALAELELGGSQGRLGLEHPRAGSGRLAGIDLDVGLGGAGRGLAAPAAAQPAQGLLILTLG